MSDDQMVSIYHAGLDRYAQVRAEAVPVLINSGWVEKDNPEPPEEDNPAQPAPGVEQEDPSEPDGSDIEEQ